MLSLSTCTVCKKSTKKVVLFRILFPGWMTPVYIANKLLFLRSLTSKGVRFWGQNNILSLYFAEKGLAFIKKQILYSGKKTFNSIRAKFILAKWCCCFDQKTFAQTLILQINWLLEPWSILVQNPMFISDISNKQPGSKRGGKIAVIGKKEIRNSERKIWCHCTNGHSSKKFPFKRSVVHLHTFEMAKISGETLSLLIGVF